jgi:uncharacterized protein YjiS (DUF1127 family)
MVAAMSLLSQIAHELRWRGFRDWFALVSEWRRRARSRRDLATMCDRSLRDLGITRYDACFEARKPFWRE